MEKNQKPRSWSELPLDLSISVFERLGFDDFHRAKPVCSSWYFASQQSSPKIQTPWLIIFPDLNNKNCCRLFNPEEKDKLYKTKDLGLEFAESVCVATYGNWLLMRDPWWNLYIVNLFTQERINLLPVMKWITDMQSPVFWIDDKTKDYVVLWGLVMKWIPDKQSPVFYAMEGDIWWKQIPGTSECIDLVYKDHKLYFLGRTGCFKIFDFSGEMIPRETFQCNLVMNTNIYVDTKLVVTVTGDVLKVEKSLSHHRTWYFRVYKFYSSGFYKNPERVYPLGDGEAMLFDRGDTFLVDGLEGVETNSIYYNRSHERSPNAIFLFNLKTQKLEKLHEFDSSSVQLSKARWFLPSFKQT